MTSCIRAILMRDEMAHLHFQINGGQAMATVAMLVAGCTQLPVNQSTFWSVHPIDGVCEVELPDSFIASLQLSQKQLIQPSNVSA